MCSLSKTNKQKLFFRIMTLKNFLLIAFLFGLFCSLEETAITQDENDLKLLGPATCLNVDRLKSLDLSEDQKREIKKAADMINANGRRKFEEHRKIFGSLKHDPNPESKNLDSDEMLSKAIQEEKSRESRSQLFQSQSKAQIQALLDILLPHQKKRLVSLCLWNVRDYRFADLLTQPFVQTKLKLTPKQVGSIQPVATKLQKEFDDELEMLKQKYRKRLMDKVMTKEEREIFGRAIGENIGSKSELEFGF